MSPNEQPAALCSFLNPGHDAICEAYSGLCDQVTWGNSIKLENAFDIAADICVYTNHNVVVETLDAEA